MAKMIANDAPKPIHTRCRITFPIIHLSRIERVWNRKQQIQYFFRSLFIVPLSMDEEDMGVGFFQTIAYLTLVIQTFLDVFVVVFLDAAAFVDLHEV
jgi:hypothetical protein